MGIRRSSIETRPPAKALLKAHYAEKAWKYHNELDILVSPANAISWPLENPTSITNATTGVKAARIRANLAARTACLDDWERRLKQREKRVAESEDALENLAALQMRRSGAVMRAIRLQWGRETAAWAHHGAGLLLIALILTSVLTIGAHWNTRNWQCNEWIGMACWGVMGYTVIAGLTYLARLWIEERVVDSKANGAFIFACMMPFLHFATCLIAAMWSVGISTVCHAV